MLKTKLLTVSILFFALFLFGCKEKEEEVHTDSFITFTDSLKRTVSIQGKPKNVVALTGSLADIWQLSGGEIAATADDAWSELGLSLGNAVNIGGAHSPNFELILSVNPDLVIASASNSSNVALLDSFTGAGINVAYFDINNFDDYLNALDICTDITGNKGKYNENGLKLEERIKNILTNYKNENISENKKKILILRASSGGVKVKSSDLLLGGMLKDFGCNNIADSNSSLLDNLNVESIIKEQPYHIFVVTMGDDTEKAKNNVTKMFEENPAWSTLNAVSNGRIHIMDKKLFNLKPNSKWAEAYEILYNILQAD